ncbi:MAG: hypothetical protein ACK564_04835, partial [Novosphingobium sp.]
LYVAIVLRVLLRLLKEEDLFTTLANAAHGAWNCGYPKAAKDLADLVESFGGTPLMDVIRVADAAIAGATFGGAAAAG